MKQSKLFFKNRNGERLAGVLYSPDDKKDFPIAIYCHGYKSSKNTSKAIAISKKLTKNGIGLFAFDFSGNGESEGIYKYATITKYIDDLRCAIDLITKKTNEIAIIGSSLGGLISLNELSKDKRAKTLVLLSPLSHFRGQIKKEIRRIKKRIKSDEKEKHHGFRFYIDALKYMRYSRYKKIRIPTLILHGDNDSLINIKDSIKLNKFIKSSKLIILKGADHRYSKEDDFNKVINKTTEFIVKNLK